MRLSIRRHKFTRSFDYQWTPEIFLVDKKFYRKETQIFKVRDLFNQKIIGTFKQFEIQAVNRDEPKVYRIEQIIKREKRNDGKTYVTIKWEGWNFHYNSTIVEDRFKFKPGQTIKKNE